MPASMNPTGQRDRATQISHAALAFHRRKAQYAHVISPFGLPGHNPLASVRATLDTHNEPDYSCSAPDLRAVLVNFLEAKNGYWNRQVL
jgi:hypothetical protein